MKIQKCNSCKTVFTDKPWIDECPVCRSKNINHNEDGSLFEWHNYGDVNFLEYGGCLVRETNREDCFNVIWLNTEIYDYKGKYKNPMIVARCFVDLSDWLKEGYDEDRNKINKFYDYPSEDYIPKTLHDKMMYCTDLISYYGIDNYEPTMPEETEYGPYSLGITGKCIVGKTIAQRFLKENGVPAKFRR